MGDSSADENENKDWETEFGIYPADEKNSSLLKAVHAGDLSKIEEILSGVDGHKHVAVLNHASRWTEVQVKSCYDKSWEWFGDTALISAARTGNFPIVKLLLLEGADPTLSSCPNDDEYETALKAVQNGAKKAEKLLDEIKKGTYKVSDRDLGRNFDPFVKEAFNHVNFCGQVIRLLQEAEKYWEKASYAHASYSKERAKAFIGIPNSPKNVEEYKKAIDLIECESEFDHNLVRDMANKLSSIQKRRRSLQPPWSKYQQSQVAWMSSIKTEKQSNLVGNLRKSINCPGCGKPPAKECVHHSCASCCSGSCPRHATDMPVMYNSFWWD